MNGCLPGIIKLVDEFVAAVTIAKDTTARGGTVLKGRIMKTVITVLEERKEGEKKGGRMEESKIQRYGIKATRKTD